MCAMGQKHHHEKEPDGDRLPVGDRPYWMRAHLDWRFWVGVGFIAAALAIYLVTVDLSLVPRHGHHQTLPNSTLQ